MELFTLRSVGLSRSTLNRSFMQAVGVACAVVFVLLSGGPYLHAQGQAVFASLNGTVQDSSGAVIPGATVTLSNPAKAFSREFKTDTSGRYVFTLIPPGTYELKVTQSGFQTYLQTGIGLTVGQTATQDVTLTLGQITQIVEVRATAPALNTANANVATDITERQIVDLPLDYRSPYFLVSINSNVSRGTVWQVFNGGGQSSGPGADQDAGAFVMSGSRFGAIGFLLDGHWNAAGDWNSIVYGPTVDETQEVKVQQNVFTAQYGFNMGAVINVITKSGTNKLHGSVFEFLRNDNLDANYWFNNRAGRPLQEFKRHQFGASVGGPVYIPGLYEKRDKTFFFASYEGVRQGTPLTLVATLPTAAFRAGDFSAMLGTQTGTDALGRPVYSGQLYNPFTTRSITAGQVDPTTGLVATESGFIRDPFQGNSIPSSVFDPVAVAAAAYYPDPTGSGLVNNFTSAITGPVRQDKYSGRIDHNISEKSRLFARWSQTFQFKTRTGAFYGPDNPAGSGEKANNPRWDLGVGYSYTFTPTFLMSVNVGVNRAVEARIEQSAGFAPSKLGLPTWFDSSSLQFPYFNIQGMYQLGGNTGQWRNPDNVGSLMLDLTKIRGGHTLNIGFHTIVFQDNTFNTNLVSFGFPQSMTQGPNPTAANPQTGLGFASFLLGTGNTGGFPLTASPAYTKKYFGGYFQDQWKITPKLTTTLGIRYDIQTSPSDRFNRLSYFDYDGKNPIQDQVAAAFGGTSPVSTPGFVVFTSPDKHGIYDSRYNNVAPRISLAYRVTDKLVWRSGFGMFFIHNYPVFYMPFQGFSQTTPFVGTVDGITPVNLLRDPYPNGLISPSGSSLGALTNVGLNVSAVPRERSSPYVEQWMSGLQYAFTPNDTLDVAYVGNHGVKLNYSSTQQNQLSLTDMALGNDLLTKVANPFFGLISSSGCGLNSATVPQGQLLRPFPQFCNVSDQTTLGASSWYNGVTMEYTHRFSHGMYLLASYTVSKFLSNGSGDQDWAAGGTATVRNFYNLAAEKGLDPNDTPQSFVLTYIAELPFGRGRHFGSNTNSALNAVLGGWQLSGSTTFKSGLPLGITTTSNNTNSLGGGQRPNLGGDPNAVPAGVDRHDMWFNTQAFAQPDAFTFGNIGRTLANTRGPGFNNWDLGLLKNFQLKEEVRLQFRAEFYNAFNHPNFYLPNTQFGNVAFGRLNQAFPGRDIQLALKLVF